MQRTRALVGALALFLMTVGIVDFGQAAAKEKPRFKISSTGWVLDTTTALQWTSTADLLLGPTDVVTAVQVCTNLGGGARLPEIKEFISLVDYSVAYPGPLLPAGHPFLNVQLTFYLSATPAAGFFTGSYWLMDFTTGVMYPFRQPGDTGWVWCVR